MTDLLYHPPDSELQALKNTINAKLQNGRVDFFCIAPGGDAQMQYAVIFQSGPRRATIRLKHRPTDYDVGDIVTGMKAWSRDADNEPLYTTEAPTF